LLVRVNELTGNSRPIRTVVVLLSYNLDNIYCARGDMENRIKEQQLGLFADRTSAHDWWVNQFRLLLSSPAYIQLESILRIALKGTELKRGHRTQLSHTRVSHTRFPPRLGQKTFPHGLETIVTHLFHWHQSWPVMPTNRKRVLCPLLCKMRISVVETY
jgi:hypothetical protein